MADIAFSSAHSTFLQLDWQDCKVSGASMFLPKMPSLQGHPSMDYRGSHGHLSPMRMGHFYQSTSACCCDCFLQVCNLHNWAWSSCKEVGAQGYTSDICADDPNPVAAPTLTTCSRSGMMQLLAALQISLPRDQRVCTLRQTGNPEDEQHLVFECIVGS